MERKRVLALIDNLFFATKLEGAAGHVGCEVTFSQQTAEVRRLMRDDPPDLVIVDMASTGIPWQELVREIKAEPATAQLPVLAFGRHTHSALFKAARQAGCDEAITNARFSEELPSLLERYLGEIRSQQT